MFSIPAPLFLIVGIYTHASDGCRVWCYVLFCSPHLKLYPSLHKMLTSCFILLLMSSVNGPNTEFGSNNTW